MPFVIAVLIIIVTVFVCKDSIKRDNAIEISNNKFYTNVNPVFENIALCKHVYDEGDDFDTAYEKALKDTVDAGFEPCITKEFYQTKVEQHYHQGREFYGYVYTSCPYRYFFADDETLLKKLCSGTYVEGCREHAKMFCYKNNDYSYAKITPYQNVKTKEEIIKEINSKNRSLEWKKNLIAEVNNDPNYIKRITYWDFDDLIYPKNMNSRIQKSEQIDRLRNAAFSKPSGELCRHPEFGTGKVIDKQITEKRTLYKVKAIKDDKIYGVYSDDPYLTFVK